MFGSDEESENALTTAPVQSCRKRDNAHLIDYLSERQAGRR